MIKVNLDSVNSKADYSNAFSLTYNSTNALLPLRNASLFTDQNEKNSNYNGRRSIYGVAVTSKMGCIKKMHCPIMFSSLISLCSIFTPIKKKSKQETSKCQVTWPIRNLAAVCKFSDYILPECDVLPLFLNGSATMSNVNKNLTQKKKKHQKNSPSTTTCKCARKFPELDGVRAHNLHITIISLLFLLIETAAQQICQGHMSCCFAHN